MSSPNKTYPPSKLYGTLTRRVFSFLLTDDEKFELCTINPGFIVGPVLGSYCTSTEVNVYFSINLLASNEKGCNLIGYATRCLFRDRQ